ncbi:CHAT domain-containing protein [Roseibium suaedae]|uniref:CHAT domain-containing protein n=1 Tax=Roseibium suaedae TaxID=735517 RepID=A0A1M6YXB1_9HYPH|nr:CHAT domain-containing protein [Roseibium suaedae]SHL22702.1 CHAT domain-containing protein [Roseibium suaedae]
MVSRVLLCLMALVLSAASASAIEIYRNSKPYDVAASLPSGFFFREEGVDRKFDVGGVAGNLRLIQDSYSECESLVDERQRNWVKYGFDQAFDRYVSPNECSISIHNSNSRESVSSFYIRIDACACYSALHFRYLEQARPDFEAYAPSIVSSVRTNNRGAAGPAIASRGAAPVAQTPAQASSKSPAQAAEVRSLPQQLPQSSASSEGGAIARIYRALDPLKCSAIGKEEVKRGEDAVILLSAWTGTKAKDLARRAGGADLSQIIYDSDWGNNKGPYLRSLERIVAAHDGAVQRIEADAQTYGAALCGIIAFSLKDTLNNLSSAQDGFNSVFHDYLKAAQTLVQLHNCGSGTIDGAFGGGSRANWNTMLEGLGLTPVSGAFTPTLSDLAKAASVPVNAPVCAGGSVQTAAPGGDQILPFLFPTDDAYTSGGWLAKRTPALRQKLESLGREGRWSAFQQMLVRRLVYEGYEPKSDVAATLLANIFEDGIGVTPDLQAARFWRGKASEKPSSFERYLVAVRTGEGLEAVTRSLSGWQSDYESNFQTPIVSGPMLYISALELSLDNRLELARLGHIVMKSSRMLELVLLEGSKELQYSLAERLLDGASILGKGTSQAVALLRRSAEQGAPYAASHLAFMMTYGNGAAANREEIGRLLQFAVGKGDPFAAYQLARLAERENPSDIQQAVKWYDKLIALNGKDGRSVAGISLIVNRIMSGSLALSNPSTQQGIEKLAQEDVFFAQEMARMYLCAECGGSLDFAEGAKWLRVMRDGKLDYANVVLYRLLTQHPELAKSKSEALDGLAKRVHIENGVLGWETDLSSYVVYKAELARNKVKTGELPGFMAEVLNQICAEPKNPEHYCEDGAKILASGALGADLVAVGLELLEKRQSIALVDVLAAYGDFTGAVERGLKAEQEELLDRAALIWPGGIREGSLFLDIDRLRSPTLRRLIAQRDPDNLKSLPKGFGEYLALLARNGDTGARNYLKLLSAPLAAPVPVQTDLGKARETFETVKARGGLNLSLVTAARIYSSALDGEGNRTQALELELTALAAERQLDQVIGFGSGALQASLTTVCHMSKASERIFAFGADDIALVLAKDVINELQRVRRDLSAIPERLQGCFRDLVADNYRWLADLLVRQDRLSEAEFVLSLLKDFEAFQFSGRDRAFEGDAFRQLPYSAEEQELKDALDALRLPTVSAVHRRDQLLARQSMQALTAREKAELDQLNQQLEEAGAAYDAGLKRILAAAKGLSDAPKAREAIAAEDSVQKTILAPLDEKAVAIHYLVMPDRLNILVTTKSERKSVTISEWRGEPFTEERLNAALANFHEVITDARLDDKPLSRDLYDLLVKPVDADLAAAAPDLVLVSLDKRLRYLPYQALYDGQRYLIERFALSLLTSSESEITGKRATGIPFAALGMTQETELFSALPGVAVELDGIVKGQDGFGLFDGQIYMDKAFDKPALVHSLKIGEASPSDLGVVHISSHFYLGESDKDSFLLLGTGEHLSLAEIKNDPKDFDFKHVELLTLSACETGRVHPDRDGREIESLAKITGDRGAQSTIASLWQVADASTAIMMQRFYELREFGNMSKARALAIVQREFITGKVGDEQNLATRSVVFETARKFGEAVPVAADGMNPGFAHPYFWAPFVLTGNWR